jgi:alkylhydroperoxidase family enzyme
MGIGAVPGLSQEKILATSSYEVSNVLDRREKLALKFAEKLGIEPEGLDDEFFDLLRQEFTDPEIVELAHVIAVGIGFERFLAVWKSRACAI